MNGDVTERARVFLQEMAKPWVQLPWTTGEICRLVQELLAALEAERKKS